MSEWIRTGVIVLGFIIATATFSFESCMTRREITAKLDALDARHDATQKRLDRIEDKVEQLNQNYIEHLVKHNQK